MKILFLIFHGLSDTSGVSKKIQAQVKGLRQGGHDVHLCTYHIRPDGHRVRMIDNSICINDYGKGQLAALKKRFHYKELGDYVVREHYDAVYCRSFHNANPFTIALFHKWKTQGITTVMEIPTYPYDQEYVGFSTLTRLQIKVDQLYRNKLAKEVDAFVTFTDDKTIFGQRTIRISNGVDLDCLPLAHDSDQPWNMRRNNGTPRDIHLIAVAEVHYWHGFDRLIAGMGIYYQKQPLTRVYLHIVGGIAPSEMHNSIHAPGFKELEDKYGLAPYIICHGQLFGKELDEVFRKADMAVGSLARHRCGIDHIKTLKNREYAARGLCFLYSETDEDFDSLPFVYKVPANETPIDIPALLHFLHAMPCTPREIRAAMMPLTWKNQMKKVTDSITALKSGKDETLV